MYIYIYDIVGRRGPAEEAAPVLFITTSNNNNYNNKHLVSDSSLGVE